MYSDPTCRLTACHLLLGAQPSLRGRKQHLLIWHRHHCSGTHTFGKVRFEVNSLTPLVLLQAPYTKTLRAQLWPSFLPLKLTWDFHPFCVQFGGWHGLRYVDGGGPKFRRHGVLGRPGDRDQPGPVRVQPAFPWSQRLPGPRRGGGRGDSIRATNDVPHRGRWTDQKTLSGMCIFVFYIGRKKSLANRAKPLHRVFSLYQYWRTILGNKATYTFIFVSFY